MARAVGFTEPGGPEVLRVIERPVREPGAGEVRIAVAAAAVNPTDCGLRSRGGGEVPGPWTPGMDAAGTIETVGPEVTDLACGDRVMAAVSPQRPRAAPRPNCWSSPRPRWCRYPTGPPSSRRPPCP